MEVRLLLAFLLMGAVMFVTPYFFKSPDAAARQEDRADRAAQRQPAAHGSAGHRARAPRRRPPPRRPPLRRRRPPRRRSPARIHDRNRPLRIAFSNQGGTSAAGCSRSTRATTTSRWTWSTPPPAWSSLLALLLRTRSPATDVNWAWYKQTVDPDGLGVTYEYSDGHTTVRKTSASRRTAISRRSRPKSRMDGKPVPHMIQWRGGFGDLTIANPAGSQRTLYFDVAAEQAGANRRPRRRQERPGDTARQLHVRRARRHLFRRRVPAGGQQPRADGHLRRHGPHAASKRSRCRFAGVAVRTDAPTTSSCSSAPRISTC